jgi:uncharacterized protein YcfJ
MVVVSNAAAIMRLCSRTRVRGTLRACVLRCRGVAETEREARTSAGIVEAVPVWSSVAGILGRRLGAGGGGGSA